MAEENQNTKPKMGLIITGIALGLIITAITIWTVTNKNISIAGSGAVTNIPRLENPTVMGTERYKIIGSVMIPKENKKDELEIGMIIHLDDGRTRVIAIPQAAREPELINVNEGYLYRVNGQIYLKKN